MVMNPPANAGDVRDVVSTPGLGRSPGGGHGNPLQYSYLENPLARGTWWAIANRVAKSQTRLKQCILRVYQFLIINVNMCHLWGTVTIFKAMC